MTAAMASSVCSRCAHARVSASRYPDAVLSNITIQPRITSVHRSKASSFGCRPRVAKNAAPKVRAQASDQRFPQPESYKIWPTEIVLSSTLYNLVCAASVVFYAGLADAAFSGDWSRIGVLTTDQEALLGEVFKFIVAAHSVVGLVAARYASQQGYNVAVAGAQGLVLGTLGLYDVYMRCQEERARNGNV